MLLDNSLYKITSQNHSSLAGEFELALNSDHIIYQSHFPGYPITPGVIQLQIITELCGVCLDKKIRISKINRSKFIKIINPEVNKTISIAISLTTQNHESEVDATITFGDIVFTKISMTLS